VKHH
jgi:YloV: DAK2 domain fusion protein YloV